MFEQTNPAWNPDLFSEELGTGIFARPKDDGSKGVIKDFVENITYGDCTKRARSGPYDHFKWVPNRIEPYDSLRYAVCAGGPCKVATDCFQTVCFCRQGECT